MPADLYINQPSNKAIFVFTNSVLPPGTYSLLSLGLKFCIRSRLPSNNINKTIDRFRHDVRVKHYLATEDPPEDPHFNPKLYIKSPFFKPKIASFAIKDALNTFKERLTAKHEQYQKACNPNITVLQNSALRKLKDNEKFIVVEADKNMGVTVWKRSEFIKQVLKEHLSNAQVYQNITHEKDNTLDDLQNEFKIFLRTHGRNLPDTTIEFFKRSQDTHGWAKVAQFRATAKVHKNPVKLRPVVAKCNTTIECLSKWLDVEFQKLGGLVPWCVKDSESFRVEVTKVDLPPNARLVTFDAVSMYSNIDLDHAMPIMRQWFESYVPAPGEPALAPVDTIMAALELVMRWNIFAFGDSYYRQLIGTAMGTSCAVWFANLYFGSHEKSKLLPRFKDLLARILFYARFVDDVFLIWLGECDLQWKALVLMFNDFGILKWECPKPKTTVDFLDLTLTVEGNKVVTKTYQKPENPYLYIPPHSAHPAGMINGIVFSLLRTYWRQNTKYSDFVHFSSLLFRRHCLQGWDQEVLRQVFSSALNKLFKNLEVPAPAPANAPEIDPLERLFLHMQYHPKDIPKDEIRQIYSDVCEELFARELNIKQFTIAYSRPTTIGSVVAKSKLFEVEGQEVSKYITGELPE